LKNLNPIEKPKLKLPQKKRCCLRVLLLGTRKLGDVNFGKFEKPKVELSLGILGEK
jgi:hypothetical protein